MNLNRREFMAGASALAVTASVPAFAQRTNAPGNAAATDLLARTAEAILTEYPENATTLGIDTGARAALKAALTGRTSAAELGRRDACLQRLDVIRAVDRKTVSPQVALDLDVTQAAHELAAEGYRRLGAGDVAILNQNVSYRSTPYLVSQGTGAFAEIPDMMESKHLIATREDADAYLARLEGYAATLNAETARVAEDGAKGTVLPRFLIDITAGQLTAAAGQPSTDWNLVTSFAAKTKAAKLEGDWSARAAKLAADSIAPALARQAAAFTALRAKASDTPGMWGLPEGADRYAWLCEAATTTRRTPDDIHQSGLEQVKALSAEMDVLLKAQGLTQGSVGARLTELGKRPDLLWPNTDAGRADLLKYLDGVIADVRPRMPRAFGKVVAGNLVIKRVPPAIEAGAPNGYAGAGSIDGKTPGNYYINLKDTATWPRFALKTLTYHEGIPGHIWQGEYTYRLPLIRSLLAFNAYSEGWGLYAEQIAAEVGVYDDDPLGRIGYLQSMNFRACRLVADTGLHHKRWTMDQAVSWFADATGFSPARARSELNRYCAWPGQALGYKIGHNEINRLRDKAKAALDARFDVKAYNDLIVGVGGVPLNVLERVVDNWAGATTA